MREEQAVIEIIPVSRQGEIKNFQVKVPMNANAVIGIETGIRMGNSAGGGAIPPPAKIPPPLPERVEARGQQSVAGELKLQSSGKPNVFYGTLVRDPFAGEDFSNPLLMPGFSERDWAFGYKKEMEKLTVDASTTIITGFYKDNLGESTGRDTAYEIFLAIWFKIEREKNDH